MNRFIHVERPGAYRDVLLAHGPWAALSGLALAGSCLVGFARLPLPSCMFLDLTGYSCPFCGYTRAFDAAASGKWAEAAQMAPIGIIVFLFVVAVFLWNAGAMIAGKRFRRGAWLTLREGRGKWVWATLAALVALNWAYRLSQGIQ